MIVTKDISKILNPLDKIASSEYFNSLGAVDWGYFVEDGAVLPFYIKKKLFFKSIVFTTGILGNKSIDEKQYLNNVIIFVKRNFNVDFVEISHVTALFSNYPDNAIYCPFGSYIIDLTLTEDEILCNMHSKHRNVIKKAIKEDVQISQGLENKFECVRLVRETLLRQGLDAFSIELFDELSNQLGDNIDFWLARLNDESHGAAILIWTSERSSYYMYGGSCENPNGGAMNLLHWEAIKKMKSRGVKYYDFVGARINPDTGSKYEGIQRFKSRFGGELKEAYLWKYIFNTSKYKLYHFLIWLKSKGTFKGDVIDQVRLSNENRK